MGGPLQGIRVIDCSRAVAGPYCAMLLGDLGADVIKVEEPGEGDEIRKWAPAYKGESCYFLVSNRNKRGLTVNLKAKQSWVILDRLLETADVLIENFRPQTARQLGFDYEAIHKRFPKLVYCSITGFGPSGPMSERPAYDALLQAYTGLMSITGEADRSPMRVGVAVADYSSALYAVYGILGALAGRDKIGGGQKVDISLMESMVSLLSYHNASFWGTGVAPARLGTAHPAVAPLRVFDTADGHMLVMTGNQKQWHALCKTLDMQGLAEDPRFFTNTDRVNNKEVLHALINDILKTKTRIEWGHRFLDADLPYAPVNGIDEIVNEPQLLHRDMVLEYEHPTLGTMKFTGFPVKLSETPLEFRQFPPAVGQHTEEILHELGFAADEVQAFKSSGTV